MPEGDVVWWYARRLRSALAGHVLTRSDLRVPRFATADLTGRMVTQVTSRGRHLFIRVDGGVSVHTHLRMDGAWRIRPAAEFIPASHRIRLVLGNASWTALGYQCRGGRRCHTPIRNQAQGAMDSPVGERITFWCPRCQR